MNTKKNVLLISLGCDKNLVDSEKMLGLLTEGGYTLVEDETQADVIIINTCCFIHDAQEESIETILSMASLKKEGRLKALVVTGCLGQRYREEIEKELPEVDAVIGTTGYTEITEILDRLLAGPKEGTLFHCPSVHRLTESLADKRVVTGGGCSASLKIAEGCDKHCTYCVIPSVRGSYRSFPMEDLLAEAQKLADMGVKELCLVAQETTLYGTDLYGEKMLPELLRKLCRIDGIEWIRLLYCYPEEITEELIAVIKSEEKICSYLDMPIQHSEDAILRQMGRKTNRAELTALIERLRAEIPGIVLRTTILTGFPGETEEMFSAMMDFIDTVKFDRLGVFPYSQEEGTPAAAMDGQIPEEEKQLRRHRIMERQQEIAAAGAAGHIGETMTVLIEGYLYEEDVYVGRTYMDAPEVDGNVFVRSERELLTGEMVPVTITEAGEYDLIGDVRYEDEFAE